MTTAKKNKKVKLWCRHNRQKTTVQGSNTERKTDRSNMSRHFVRSFSSKIILTRINLSLFEQGTLCLQVAHSCDNENRENGQCVYNHMQPVSVKRG